MLNPTQTPATAPTTHKYHTKFAKALTRYSLEYHDYQIKKHHGADTQDLDDFRLTTSRALANSFTSQGLHNPLVGSFHFPANALRPDDTNQTSLFTWYQASLSLLTVNEMLPETARETAEPLVRTVVKELHASLHYALFDGSNPRNESVPLESLLMKDRVDTKQLRALLDKVVEQLLADSSMVNIPARDTVRNISYNMENTSNSDLIYFAYLATTAVSGSVPFGSYYSRALVYMYPGLFDCSKTSPNQMAKLIRLWGDTLLTVMGLHEIETAGLVLLSALKANHPVLYDLVLGHINERKKATPTLSAVLSDSVLPKTKDEAEYLLRTLENPEDNEVYPNVQALFDIRGQLEENKISSIGYREYSPRLRYTKLLGLEGNLVRVHADGQITRNMLTRVADRTPNLITEPPTVQVEFYASVADRMRGKKTLMKLGRFVKKYLHADDELTLHMVEAVRNKYAPKEVTVIPDTDLLSWSYVYANASVKSCMTPDTNQTKANPNSAQARAMQSYAIGAALERIQSEAANAATTQTDNLNNPEAKHDQQTHADLEEYYLRKADALQGWLETAPRLALVVMHNTNDTATAPQADHSATNQATGQATNQTDPSRWLETDIVARAVVNTTNKTYNKVYGDTRLARWLQDNGYRHDEGTTFGALLFVEERATLEPIRHDSDKVTGYGSYLNTPFVDGSVYGLVRDHVVLPDESSPFERDHRTRVIAGHQSRWFVVEAVPNTDNGDIFYTDNGDRRVNVLSLRETDNRSYTIWEP